MPSNINGAHESVLKKLVRSSPLTHEEWIELIESRRALIKPHLDSFTLQELGDTKCVCCHFNDNLPMVHSLNFPHSIVTKGDERFSLKTQGIFFVPSGQPARRLGIYSGQVDKDPDPSLKPRVLHLCGLIRSGTWVIVVVVFEAGISDEEWFSGPLHHSASDYVTSIEIIEVELEQMLTITKVSPAEIWHQLRSQIGYFVERRKKLYEQARELADRVNLEERLYELIPTKE